MCKNLASDEILIRAVPSLMYFLRDSSSKVVSTAISCLTSSMENVTEVARSQRKVFVEYIFPDLLETVFTRFTKMSAAEAKVKLNLHPIG